MEKTIGSGFAIINNDGHTSPEDWTEFYNPLLAESRTKRCELIAKCIDVENEIGDLINYFFNRENMEYAEIFSKFIVNQSFFSFRIRKQILISIIEKYSQYFKNVKKGNGIKEFSKKVDNIIATRNLLAHGEMILDLKDKKVKMIRYSIEDLKDENKTLDSKFYEKLDQDIKFSINFCMACKIFLKYNKIIPTDENYAPLQQAFIF